MEIPRYHINVFWSDEDNAWIANVPDLEGCSASGDDPVEAVSEVLAAQAGWLRVAPEYGDPIPEPRYRPAAYAADGPTLLQCPYCHGAFKPRVKHPRSCPICKRYFAAAKAGAKTPVPVSATAD